MLMFKLILCQMAFENPYLIERMISLKKEKGNRNWQVILWFIIEVLKSARVALKHFGSRFAVIRIVTPFHPGELSDLIVYHIKMYQGSDNVIQYWIFDPSSLKIFITGNNMLDRYKQMS